MTAAYLTPAQVAAMLGLTLRQVKARRLAGDLKGIPETPGNDAPARHQWQAAARAPRKYLFEPAEVKAYMERRKGA